MQVDRQPESNSDPKIGVVHRYPLWDQSGPEVTIGAVLAMSSLVCLWNGLTLNSSVISLMGLFLGSLGFGVFASARNKARTHYILVTEKGIEYRFDRYGKTVIPGDEITLIEHHVHYGSKKKELLILWNRGKLIVRPTVQSYGELLCELEFLTRRSIPTRVFLLRLTKASAMSKVLIILMGMYPCLIDTIKDLAKGNTDSAAIGVAFILVMVSSYSAWVWRQVRLSNIQPDSGFTIKDI